MDECLLPVQLTAHQYTVLSLVRRFAPTTSAELARRLQVSAQSMGESLRALEGRGFILRGNSEQNRRVVTLQLTPPGKRTLQKADRLVTTAESVFFKCLKPSAHDAMGNAIQTLRESHSVTRWEQPADGAH
jgi:DNA-binding MarR family transcriptional regulator